MIEGRRPLGTVARHRLRGLCPVAMRVGGADCDYVRIVSRRAYCGVSTRASGGILAHVARCNHDDDTRPPRRFNGLAQRIEGIAFVYAARQREIHDANVVRAL